MTQQHWVVACAFALASFAVSAQPAASRPDPLDASAAVPPAVYKSVFEGYQRSASAEQPSPDKLWRQANADVGSPDEHSGHTAAPAQPPATPATVPTTPAPAPAPAAKSPVDHSKHDHG